MANEISVSVSLSCVNPASSGGLARSGGGAFSFSDTKALTQTTQGAGNPGTLTFTTAEADIAFTGLTAPRQCVIKNLDTTVYFIYGPKSSGAMVELGRIPPGMTDKISIGNSVTLRGKMSGGTGSKVYIAACEE